MEKDIPRELFLDSESEDEPTSHDSDSDQDEKTRWHT
jgi:hypothetical protein